jgi:phosphoribosylanthranilate isomerase
MHLKICGLREPENIEAVLDLKPDYLGFIFYVRSSRYAGRHLDPYFARDITQAKKVGVFVDEDRFQIEETVDRFRLDLVQLHGQESPELCQHMRSQGVGVIKVFSVGAAFDFEVLADYEPAVDYFLFDTKGKLPGGNGYTFDWQLLQAYPSQKPFFLSGGIGPEHSEMLPQLSLPHLHALDVNSKFEVKPGRKDPEKLRAFRAAMPVS